MKRRSVTRALIARALHEAGGTITARPGDQTVAPAILDRFPHSRETSLSTISGCLRDMETSGQVKRELRGAQNLVYAATLVDDQGLLEYAEKYLNGGTKVKELKPLKPLRVFEPKAAESTTELSEILDLARLIAALPASDRQAIRELLS